MSTLSRSLIFSFAAIGIWFGFLGVVFWRTHDLNGSALSFVLLLVGILFVCLVGVFIFVVVRPVVLGLTKLHSLVDEWPQAFDGLSQRVERSWQNTGLSEIDSLGVLVIKCQGHVVDRKLHLTDQVESLKKQNQTLERAQALFIERELKMIELKQTIDDLQQKLLRIGLAGEEQQVHKKEV